MRKSQSAQHICSINLCPSADCLDCNTHAAPWIRALFLARCSHVCPLNRTLYCWSVKYTHLWEFFFIPKIAFFFVQWATQRNFSPPTHFCTSIQSLFVQANIFFCPGWGPSCFALAWHWASGSTAYGVTPKFMFVRWWPWKLLPPITQPPHHIQ